MDQETLNYINQVLYYYEEYEKGNEDVIPAIETFAKGIQHGTKKKVKYYYIYKFLINFMKCRISLFSPSVLEEDDYKTLINYSNIDIEYYLEVSNILKNFISECLKDGSYEHLDDAYILSIKLSLILSNISEYFSHIKGLQEYASSSISYKYPSSIDTTRNSINSEIKLLLSHIVKEK